MDATALGSLSASASSSAETGTWLPLSAVVRRTRDGLSSLTREGCGFESPASGRGDEARVVLQTDKQTHTKATRVPVGRQGRFLSRMCLPARHHPPLHPRGLISDKQISCVYVIDGAHLIGQGRRTSQHRMTLPPTCTLCAVSDWPEPPQSHTAADSMHVLQQKSTAAETQGRRR